MNFKEFRERKILEKRLFSIIQCWQKRTVGIISSFKFNYEKIKDEEEIYNKNINRHMELRNLITNEGYAYNVLKGCWDEEKENPKDELLFFITTTPERTIELLKDLKKWRELFNLETFLFKPHYSENIYLNYSTDSLDCDENQPVLKGEIKPAGKFSPGKIAEIYSRTKQEGNFVFTKNYEYKGFCGALLERQKKKNLEKICKQKDFWVKDSDVYDLEGKTQLAYIFSNSFTFGYYRTGEVGQILSILEQNIGDKKIAVEELFIQVFKRGFVKINKEEKFTKVEFDNFSKRQVVICNFLLWAVSNDILLEEDDVILKGFEDDFYEKDSVTNILEKNKKILEENFMHFGVKKLKA